MKYYSETLNRLFATEEELKESEKEYNKQLAVKEAEKLEKKNAAMEVEEAFKKANEEYKIANEKLRAFTKKYGAFHTTVTDENNLISKSLMSFFFDNWMF